MTCTVIYAADEAYAIPLAASLHGLAASLGRRGNVVVLDTGLSAASRARLVACVPATWTVSFPHLPAAWTERLPDPGRFSRAAYGRFFVHEVAGGADRVIYLDADTLPLRLLHQLAATDLGGSVAAAVRDEYVTSFGAPDGPAARDPALDPELPYFNSGVLVIDVARWRRERVHERAIRWLREAGQGVDFVDQDALNVALRGLWRELPASWNVGRYWYRPERRTGAFAAIAEEARILHYTTEYKPWVVPDTVPDWARAPFYAALDRTPWAGWRPAGWVDKVGRQEPALLEQHPRTPPSDASTSPRSCARSS